MDVAVLAIEEKMKQKVEIRENKVGIPCYSFVKICWIYIFLPQG